MLAVDTNLLVYAEVLASAHHKQARKTLQELAEGALPWAIPWPCVYEFIRIVTHPRVFHLPIPLEVVLDDLRALLQSPSVVLLSETPAHFAILEGLLRESDATGNLTQDAHIAALCREHGVTELMTADRDFSRFKGLRIRNPFERLARKS